MYRRAVLVRASARCDCTVCVDVGEANAEGGPAPRQCDSLSSTVLPACTPAAERPSARRQATLGAVGGAAAAGNNWQWLRPPRPRAAATPPGRPLYKQRSTARRQGGRCTPPPRAHYSEGQRCCLPFPDASGRPEKTRRGQCKGPSTIERLARARHQYKPAKHRVYRSSHGASFDVSSSLLRSVC